MSGTCAFLTVTGPPDKHVGDSRVLHAAVMKSSQRDTVFIFTICFYFHATCDKKCVNVMRASLPKAQGL